MTPPGGAAAKPAPADLGIDPRELRWERSGKRAGSIEIAMPSEWVLMRLAGDPSGRILVFDAERMGVLRRRRAKRRVRRVRQLGRI